MGEDVKEVKVKLSLCLAMYHRHAMKMHEGVSKSFRTESVTKYTFTTINTR